MLDESDDAVIAAVTRELREIAGVTATPALHTNRPLAALDGAVSRGTSSAHGRTGPGSPQFPACTSPATPTRASASPTASAWARRPPVTLSAS